MNYEKNCLFFFIKIDYSYMKSCQKVLIVGQFR